MENPNLSTLLKCFSLKKTGLGGHGLDINYQNHSEFCQLASWGKHRDSPQLKGHWVTGLVWSSLQRIPWAWWEAGYRRGYDNTELGVCVKPGIRAYISNQLGHLIQVPTHLSAALWGLQWLKKQKSGWPCCSQWMAAELKPKSLCTGQRACYS